jgi:Glycosyl transferase family 11
LKRKLVVRLKGGLGNQLFCYATARRLAWINDAELIIDDDSGFRYDDLYKRKYALGRFNIPVRFATPSERLEPLGRLRRYVKRKLSERKPISERRYIQQVGVDFCPELLNLQLKNGFNWLDPFGQSERYFSDIAILLRKDLEMSPPDSEANHAIVRKIRNCVSVALHVRWFEVEAQSGSSNISLEYYERALRALRDRLSNFELFIFSDYPERAETMLAPALGDLRRTLVKENVETGDAISDFWLMRQCRHFVIGNSTFAWWAAWLGEQADGSTIVIAPSCYIDPERNVTAWGFDGLLPERWTVL